jgi:DDE superfamily endonuclease
VYFQDECHFKLTLTIIRAWFLKGSFPEIKSPTDRFKMSVLGVNGQLILEQSAIFNAITFQEFLEKIVIQATVGVNNNGRKKKILLVLDNARYHHAKIIQPWLEEMQDVIELFFLPPYSPDLNAIEMLWKKTRRAVTHNRFFESLDNLKYDLKMYWNQFAMVNEELKLLTAFI